jgi:hypothetical protein
MKRFYSTLLASLVLTIPGSAQQQSTRQAQINGNAVDGKCTIEVVVDGAAEVEVQGTTGRMRNLSGSRPEWRRFVCNGRMPNNPADFRFRGIDGRGDVQLIRDPRQGGPIVFRIEDPKGGREGYTVDLEWRGGSNNNGGQWDSQDNRGWRGPGYSGQNRNNNNNNNPGPGFNNGNLDRRYYESNGRWNSAGTARAIQICQSAAADRMQRDGFKNVKFRNVSPDNNPGRNDWVVGSATAKQGRRNSNFQFSCSADLSTGQVRTIEVNRSR